jgi:hypothetical protein
MASPQAQDSQNETQNPGQVESQDAQNEAYKQQRSVIKAGFAMARDRPANIEEHIENLYRYARKCDSVVEFGVENVVSTWAFLKALTDDPATIARKRLVGVDIVRSENVRSVEVLAEAIGLSYTFVLGDSAKVDIGAMDLLFIDSYHVYGHLKRELQKHHENVGKYIIMHDTTVDGVRGEALRYNRDIVAESRVRGYPPEEIGRGLWPAIKEFLAAHPAEWKLSMRYYRCNGLTVLKRVGWAPALADTDKK